MAKKKTPPWNGLSPLKVSAVCRLLHRLTYGTHDGCLPVELCRLSVCAHPDAVLLLRLTRTDRSKKIVTYQVVSYGTRGA